MNSQHDDIPHLLGFSSSSVRAERSRMDQCTAHSNHHCTAHCTMYCTQQPPLYCTQPSNGPAKSNGAAHSPPSSMPCVCPPRCLYYTHTLFSIECVPLLYSHEAPSKFAPAGRTSSLLISYVTPHVIRYAAGLACA